MTSESQLRRRARAQGLTLIKYRERSRWFNQYGPYALADSSSGLVAYSMAFEDVQSTLTQ